MRDQTRRLLEDAASTYGRLCTIAREAGAAAMRFYGQPVDAEEKASGGPVTAADRAAHRVIVDSLLAWTPTIPIVSEEGEMPSRDEVASWPRFWLVDPLDGTKEFLAGNGQFTVNVALVDRGVPVLGVVYAPALDVLYFAAERQGAWRKRADEPLERIFSEPWRPEMPARIVESRSHGTEEAEEYVRKLKVAERIRIGSSLKFCLIAEGSADLYPRFGPIMEWDVAAGDCVFRNSGLSAPRRSPIRYKQPDFRLSGFVIGADD